MARISKRRLEAIQDALGNMLGGAIDHPRLKREDYEAAAEWVNEKLAFLRERAERRRQK